MDEVTRDELSTTLQELTRLDNPNSVLQMRQWLSSQGVETESLEKKAVLKLKDDFVGDKIGDVLSL